MSRSPYELDTVISWLETKDPNETYNFNDIFNCLFFRYFTAMGFPVASVGGDIWTDRDMHTHHFPFKWSEAICHLHTFGEALEALRKLKLKVKAESE